MEQFTIAALSTPAGYGGIGIVRISGESAVAVAARVFRSRSGKVLHEARGYTGMLGWIVDGEVELDDAIAFVYRAPRSYTGEDVVELSCHGGAWVLQRVLRLCIENGACAAAPGEFTKRAFLNGKMALSEAESVMDIIAAQGDAALRAAMSGKGGRLTGEIQGLVDELLQQSAHLSAWADYPDEGLEELDPRKLLPALERCLGKMTALLDTWDRGQLVREGASTVIVGKPNVGKSALMNLLARMERSIVTEIPGTTRDVVEESIRLGDCLLRIADTAGIRETRDVVEQIGVSRTLERMETADLILAVFDSSDILRNEDRKLLDLLRDKPCIAVVNKIDLPCRLDLQRIAGSIPRLVQISARDGSGREELEQAVVRVLGLDRFDPTAALVATERQRRSLLLARDSLEGAVRALGDGMTLDAVNVALDYALDELLALTGQRASDAVVNEVFSRFCVGK